MRRAILRELARMQRATIIPMTNKERDMLKELRRQVKEGRLTVEEAREIWGRRVR